MSRFEHADKIIKRLRKRYRRKGLGRPLGKQSADRRSESPIEKEMISTATNEKRGLPA
jgi:hypothetical protein